MGRSDPLEVFRQFAIENGLLTEEELDQLREKSVRDIEEAIEFTKESPEPSPESLYQDVFAD